MTGDEDMRRKDAEQPPASADERTEQLVEKVRDAIASGLGGHGAVVAVGAAILLAVAASTLGLLPPLVSPSSTAGTGGGQARLQGAAASAGASLFTPVTAGDLDKAITLLMLPDGDKASVRTQIQRGTLRIALITVSDNDAEDGDWVSIGAAGFKQDVRLFHKPYVVAVPYLPGMPVAVTGLKDGGGGDITVAVTVGAAKLPLKPLKERETVELLPP